MSQNVEHHSVKNEIKRTFSLGMPLVISQLTIACSPLITVAMVARLGQAALAASILVSSAYWALTTLFTALFNAVGVLVAHQYGAKNEKAICEITGQAFLLAFLMSALLMIILACLPYFLNWHTQPIAVAQLAHNYLHSLIFTIPGLMIWVVIAQCLIGMGHTRTILVMNIFGMPLEISVIYLLIFGKLGLPAYHIAGAGYGLAITFIVEIVCIVLFLLTSKRYKTLKIFSRIGTLHKAYLKELIRIGFPLGLMGFIEASTFAVITLWMARFGTTLLAAHQILMQYLGFFIVMVFAISETIAIRVGHAVGRQDLMGIHYATYVGVGLSFFSTCFFAFFFHFFPHYFLTIDININDPVNKDLVKTASLFLSMLSVFLLIASVYLTIGFGALRALKDTRFIMTVSLLSFWIMGLGLAFLFCFVFHFTGSFLWVGLTLGNVIGMVVLIARWFYLIRHVDLAKLVHVET